ncbi:hypothetical protein BGW38_007426, partial [Lunasporangiospora selenospora]
TMSESPAAVERTPSYNTGRPKKRTSSTASSPSHTPSAWSSSQLSTSLPSSFDPARPERPIKAFRTLSSPRLQTMQPWSSHEREALYVAVQRMNLFGRWDQVQARMGLERSPDEIAREYMRLYGELHDDDFEDDDDHDEYEYEDEEDDEGWHLSRQEMEDRSEDENESNARALASGGGGGSGSGGGGGGGGSGSGRLATPALTAASSTASLSARSSQETFSGPLFHRPSQPTPSEGSYHARPSTRPPHHPTSSSPSSSSPLQSFPYPSSKSPQGAPSQQFRYSPPQSAALPHGYSPSAGGPPSPRNLYHHPPAQPLNPSKDKPSSQHAYPSRRAGGMDDPLDEDCDEMRIDHVEPPPSRARPTATGNSGGNNKGETDVTRRRFDGKPTRTVRVWTMKQSEQLKRLIEDCFPDGYRINWVWVAAQMGNTFTRKQCKNKWEIMRRRAGTEEEIHLLRQGLREFGTSWSQIQEKYLPERSQGGISIMWNLLQEREAEQRRQQLDPSSAERPWPAAVPPRPSPRSPRARSASSSSVPTTISRTTGAGRGGSNKGVKERAGSGHMEANAQAHDYGSSMDTTMTTATTLMMTTSPPPTERIPGNVHRYSRENSEDEHLHSYPHHRQQHHSSPYHQQPQQQQPLPLSPNQQRPNPRGGSEYFSSSKVSSADM